MKNSETIQKQESALYKALLSEVLKRSSSALVLLNTEAEIRWSSSGAAAITGYSCEELVGESVFDFFHPGDLPAARRQLNYLTNGHGNASAFVLRIRDKNGEMRWIDVVVHNLLHVHEVHALLVFLKTSHDGAADERALALAVTAAKEQEREFLATELHDNVNQVLTATKLLVDLVRMNSEGDELLKIASDNLKLASEEIRKLTYSMVSYDLQEFGLSFAFRTFINTVSRASELTFHTRLEEDALHVLTADQQLQVYRILQEGITNIIRHAEATLAEIVLSRNADRIYLTISDNGKGFPMNRVKPGVGLSSITHRVKVLEGHFHVRAPEGKGTFIEIHFPM